MSTPVGAKYVLDKMLEGIEGNREALEARIEALSESSEPMTNEEAIAFNYDLAAYNMFAQLAASVQKEIIDTLKGILAKM